MLLLPGLIFFGLYLYFDVTFLAIISILIFTLGLFPLFSRKSDSLLFGILFVVIIIFRNLFFPQKGMIDAILWNLLFFNLFFILMPWIMMLVGIPLIGIFSIFKKNKD